MVFHGGHDLRDMLRSEERNCEVRTETCTYITQEESTGYSIYSCRVTDRLGACYQLFVSPLTIGVDLDRLAMSTVTQHSPTVAFHTLSLDTHHYFCITVP